jgi:hypothetical protein
LERQKKGTPLKAKATPRSGTTEDVIELGMAKARHRRTVLPAVDANESTDVLEIRKTP